MISIPGVRISTAESIARVAHGDQKHGHRDFIEHPRHVVEVLKRFQVLDPAVVPKDWGEEIVTAGWLHDVVEDTGYPLEEIQKVFGARVADLVDAVTNEETASATFRKTAGFRWPYAVILKLADRIANVEYSWSCLDTTHLDKYRAAHPAFREALRPSETSEDHITSRMFRYLDHLLAVPE